MLPATHIFGWPVEHLRQQTVDQSCPGVGLGLAFEWVLGKIVLELPERFEAFFAAFHVPPGSPNEGYDCSPHVSRTRAGPSLTHLADQITVSAPDRVDLVRSGKPDRKSTRL